MTVELAREAGWVVERFGKTFSEGCEQVLQTIFYGATESLFVMFAVGETMEFGAYDFTLKVVSGVDVAIFIISHAMGQEPELMERPM